MNPSLPVNAIAVVSTRGAGDGVRARATPMAATRAAIGIAESSEQIVEFADYFAVDE
jgi:hypothetical protein